VGYLRHPIVANLLGDVCLHGSLEKGRNVTFTWSQLFTNEWEFLGFITGIFSVLLLLPTRWPRLQWLAWPFGVITSAVYLFLFYDWTLYGNAILQVPFVFISAQGAYLWRGQLRGIVSNVKEIPTTYASKTVFIWCCLLPLIAMAGVYPLLDHYNDASPLWDGLILTISLAAIFLQLRKHVQSWYLWIVVDLIAVPFHFDQDRGATAVLYLVYMIMCFVGWKTWHNAVAKGTVDKPQEYDYDPHGDGLAYWPTTPKGTYEEDVTILLGKPST
jgi:nicotinamide mononucleotide transporter